MAFNERDLNSPRSTTHVVPTCRLLLIRLVDVDSRITRILCAKLCPVVQGRHS